MRRRPRLPILLGAAALLVAARAMADAPPCPSELSPAEVELVRLISDFRAQEKPFFERIETLGDYGKALAEIEAGTLADPSADFIPRLLDFERRHRGEEVGLQALRHVFNAANSGYPAGTPPAVGRLEALRRLFAYRTQPLAPFVIRRAALGKFAPEAFACLRSLANAADASIGVQQAARLYLADALLRLPPALEAKAERRSAIAGSEPELWTGELAELEHRLGLFSSPDAVVAGVEEACQMLESLAASTQRVRRNEIEVFDAERSIFRAVEDPSQPTFIDLAAARLFKHRHLRVGAPAPRLEVTPVGRDPWSLAEQRGKVVIVQFSFTGCGPCERMYPDLAAMVAEHGDRISVLTIMRDATPEHIVEGLTNGKFSWPVVHDGDPGRLCTAWSIEGFPGIFVFDCAGVLASVGLRGEELRQAVAGLLND